MMKKIKIIGLISVILISLIGIPSVKHFCDMMDISFSGGCESSCNYEPESDLTTDACCSAEMANHFTIVLVTQDYNCCSDEFIFNKIDAEFLINKTELLSRTLNSEIIINIPLDKTLTEFTSARFFIRDLSPPSVYKPEIYLSTHSLLI